MQSVWVFNRCWHIVSGISRVLDGVLNGMMDDPVIGIDGELVGMDEGNKDGWSLRAMDKKMQWVALSKPIVEMRILGS